MGASAHGDIELILQAGAKDSRGGKFELRDKRYLGSVILDGNEGLSLVRGLVFRHCSFGVLRLLNFQVENLVLDGCDIDHFEAETTSIYHCRILDTACNSVTLRNVVFAQSRITSASLGTCDLADVTLRSLEMTHSTCSEVVAKGFVHAKDSVLDLRIENDSTFAKVGLYLSTIRVHSLLGSLQLSKVILSKCAVEECRLEGSARDLTVEASTLRDSEITLSQAAAGSSRDSAIVKSVIRGLDLLKFTLHNTALVESALPDLGVPKMEPHRLLFKKPGWLPSHSISEVAGIDPAHRKTLRQLEAKKRVEDVRREGGLKRAWITAWAVLSGYGQSAGRLFVTGVLLMAASSISLTFPEFGVEERVRCQVPAVSSPRKPSMSGNEIPNNESGERCVRETFRRLRYDESVAETLAVWTTGSTTRIQARTWAGVLSILAVAAVGVTVLALILTAITFNILRLWRS